MRGLKRALADRCKDDLSVDFNQATTSRSYIDLHCKLTEGQGKISLVALLHDWMRSCLNCTVLVSLYIKKEECICLGVNAV